MNVKEIFNDDIFEDESVLKKKINVEKELEKFQEKTKVLDEFVLNSTKHEAVAPVDYKDYSSIPRTPRVNAKQFSFELDTFQALAISAIEEDRTVLVSAHTSCGKTVVAEYAIAQSIANKQRVVYTSPIKALSNQKFRELKEEFEDVGLMTGDVTWNPDATCLVMTTEILRNMLYRGNQLVREIHWIVFDEIHYLKDKERGVVWEETIILLPRHVRMIFLSATIPNAREFGEWISSVSSQVVHIIYTEKRVIPLVHYFYSADNILREIKSPDGRFNTENFMSAQSHIIPRKNIDKVLVSLLETVNLPAVVFSFSRASCEFYATRLTRDFLSAEEKDLVRTIFSKAMEMLTEADRNLPAIKGILPLFERGIGIHHSGLVPIIKEISEILFQESLIKVLFATETFSIGLNMPAKTTVFTSIKKFDGVNERILTSGEYTQMSGRAGRRGLDDVGIVISLVTDKLSSKQILDMLSKGSDKLRSAFRLSYNMLLNLMRVEDLDTDFMLRNSFYHFQAFKSAIALKTSLKHPEFLWGSHDLACPRTEKFSNLFREFEKILVKHNSHLSDTLSSLIKESHRIVDIMVPRAGLPLFILNCIVKEFISRHDANYISVYVLVNGDVEIRDFPIEFVTCVYDFRGKVDLKVFGSSFPPIKFPWSHDEILRIKTLEEKLKISRSHCIICKQETTACLSFNSPSRYINRSEYLLEYSKCIKLRESLSINNTKGSFSTKDISVNSCVYDIQCIEYEKKKSDLLDLMEIYHMQKCTKMINVLRLLGHLEGNYCTLKGKMASEISSADELLLTEMIFSTSFNQLAIEDMMALLSVVVTEKSNEAKGIVVSPENQKLIDSIFSPAISYIIKVLRSCGFEDIDYTSYLTQNNHNFYLMDIVRMWVSGCSFAEICSSTKIFEGTIIRGFKRLEEILRQLVNAATVIGNQKLIDLFSQGIFYIKRDIVFSNSLYFL